jgi:crooked neck
MEEAVLTKRRHYLEQ